MIGKSRLLFELSLAVTLTLIFVTDGRAQSAKGTWVDPSTGLMWASQDNDSNVSWNLANRYCSQLTTSDFRDWRLPSLAELRNLYDPSATWAKHNLRAPIMLRHSSAWSATMDNSNKARYEYFNFLDGKTYSHEPDFPGGEHVLCVRQVARSK